MTRRLTRADRERIRAKVEELAEQPRGEPVFGRGLIGFRRAASARCPHCNALVTFPGLVLEGRNLP